MQENRAKIKSENPELSLGELSSKAGEIWRTISDSDKSVWDAKAAEDRRRYKLEMKRWETEQSSKKSSKYSKKSQENTSKFSKDSASASGIIPDFQLYGNANDLLWFGDDEELYANPKPSTRYKHLKLFCIVCTNIFWQKIREITFHKKEYAKWWNLTRQTQFFPSK